MVVPHLYNLVRIQGGLHPDTLKSQLVSHGAYWIKWWE